VATNNTNDGFYLTGPGSNNTLTDNTARNNTQHGFYLYSSSSNTLTNNTGENNNYSGYYLYDSYNSNLTNNTAMVNNQYGFALTSVTLVTPLIGPVSAGYPNNIAKYNVIADIYIDGTLYWTTIPDIAIIQTTFSDNVTWYAMSSNAASYTIDLDETLVQSGIWISGVNITYSLKGFSPNIYNITLVVTDIYGNSASHSAIITIPSPSSVITETSISTSTVTEPASTITTSVPDTITNTEFVTSTNTETTTSTTLETSFTTIISQIIETITKTTEGFGIVFISMGILSLILIRRKRKEG
jgi:parallel beta-helix repeat protein